MGWRTQLADHRCPLPRIGRRVGLGSTWECDSCGRVWQVARTVDAAHAKFWRLVNTRPPESFTFTTR
jgi:hypothetical protein